MQNKATFFAPGKLFLAGEYAVTAPGGEALILPVKKGIRVSIHARRKSRIINRQYPQESMQFVWISEIDNPQIRLALEVVRQLIQLKGMSWRNFTMTIDSSLVAKHGKYGLGSSGALTVAVIGALLKFYGITFDSVMLYKLAVIATLHHNEHTSFGDVACSSAGVAIRYRKFKPQLLAAMKTLQIEKLLTLKWDELILEPIAIPKEKPIVIYSGTSASSSELVKKAAPFITEDWIHKSNHLVQKILHNLKVILEVNQLFRGLEKKAKVVLFTPAIKQIIHIAIQHNGFAKFSGAGGGDSVLAFIPPKEKDGFLLDMKKAKYEVLFDII